MNSNPPIRILYRLIGHPRRKGLALREVDLSHIPVRVLWHIFHAGPNNQLLEPRHVNIEKAEYLQAYCSDSFDFQDYRWEFVAQWSDRPLR